MRKPAVLILTLALAFTAADALAWNFFDRNPAEIPASSPEAVREFVEMNIDIDSVGPDKVRVYVTPEEFEALAARGYAIQWIPNEARIYLDTLWKETRESLNPLDAYHTHEELTTELQAIEAAHPSLCRLESAGLSVQGRELWWLNISDNAGTEEDEPEFHYISTMHGDEVVGMEMCMYLINHLVDNYGTDPQVTSLVDDTEIWIMPLMNPDGNAAGSRYNANGHDLNRNFPDFVTDPDNTTTGRPAEIQHVMNWAFDHTPTLSANLHGGALVVNYPWDSTYDLNPDNDLFIFISEAYSIHNVPMWNGAWTHGITNGAAWYLVHGGMQDWSYYWMGCNEVTIELSDVKWPTASQLPGFWDDNRDAMLAYMEQVHIGVRGLVTDAVSGLPVEAEVRVQGIDHSIYTDPDVGDYHRMLLPGDYTLVFLAPGYETLQVSGVTVTSGPATVLDVEMEIDVTNDPPFDPESPSPGDGASNQAVNVTLQWSGGDPDSGDTVTYSVYLDTVDPPVTLADTVSEPAGTISIEYQPAQLDYEATYYWQIVAEDEGGLSTTGPVWSFTTGQQPGCFIATASFGSAMEGKVELLSRFRDSVLLQHPLGRAFVAGYYRYSPPIADFIAERGWLKALVRMLMLPVVGVVAVVG